MLNGEIKKKKSWDHDNSTESKLKKITKLNSQTT